MRLLQLHLFSHFIFPVEVTTATIAADFPQLGQSQPHLMATSHMLCHMSHHSHASRHMSHVTCRTSHASHDSVSCHAVMHHMSHVTPITWPSCDHSMDQSGDNQQTSLIVTCYLPQHSVNFYRRLSNPYVQLCINTPRNALKNPSSFSCEYISVPWLTDPPESSFLSSAPVCTLIAYLASATAKILSDSAITSILLSLCLVSIAFNVALLYSSRRYLFPCISRPSPPASAVA